MLTILSILLVGLTFLIPVPPPTSSAVPTSLKISQDPDTIKTTLADPSLPKPLTLSTPTVSKPPASLPWGQTEKIGDHLYRTYVANDPAMAAPGDILAALNLYRQNHGRGPLTSDEKICQFSVFRAGEQQAGLDSHAGFQKYLEDPKHWEDLGITGIGENASYGYVLSGTHLIEWVFNADDEHRNNQLNPDWTLACAAVSGKTVNIIFAKR